MSNIEVQRIARYNKERAHSFHAVPPGGERGPLSIRYSCTKAFIVVHSLYMHARAVILKRRVMEFEKSRTR